MKRLHLVPIILCVSLSFPVMAEPALTPQLQGEVKFVSGGIGVDELNAMQALRRDYNVSLLFTVKGSGAYLSDVDVLITDSKGNSVLATRSDGPQLFAQLKPGHYFVRLTQDGRVIEKAIVVGAKRTLSLSFAWPQVNGD